MTNKKIITAAFSVTIIHFLFTSVIGHYIAVQVGSQMGKIVADGLIEASEKNTNNAEEEAKRIYDNMKANSNELNESWKISRLLISLPAKPLFTPLLKEMRQKQINKVIAKEISSDQFRTHVLITGYTANFLNSLSLGVLVYIMLRILKYKR